MVKKLEYEQQAKVFAALADPTRLKIIDLLTAHEQMSGNEIADGLGISLALFCHHSKLLTEAGLITKRRQGLLRYHSLNRVFLTRCLEEMKNQISLL